MAEILFEALGAAVATILANAFMQYRSPGGVADWIVHSFPGFLTTVVLAFLIVLILYFILGKLFPGFFILSVVLYVLSIIGGIKLSSRGVPVFPWDITMIREALSVAGGYKPVLGLPELVGILMILVVTVVLFARDFGRPGIRRKRRLFGFFVSAVCLAGAFCFTAFLYPRISGTESLKQYRPAEYYGKAGGFTAVVSYIPDSFGQQKPENYSAETMEEIREMLSDTYKEAPDDPEQAKTPDIIAVMSESFWDISRLDTLDFSEDPMPVLHALQKESIHGNGLSHVFGGGTVISEFEFLTGYSGEFFPSDYMVYGNFLEDGFPSVVSLLNEQGYTTIGMHPFKASNYNRKKTYEKLGFDRTLFEENFDQDSELIRGHISDSAMFRQMIEEYEKEREAGNAPVFLFGVTMQNHGGYWEKTLYEEGLPKYEAADYNETTLGSVADYAAGLHEADRAIGELVDHFRNADRDTVIVLFGDHMCDAGIAEDMMLSRSGWNRDADTYIYETHQIPVVIWRNYSDEAVDLGEIQISQIIPEMLKRCGMKQTAFDRFLLDLRDSCGATGFGLVAGPDGTFSDIEKMTEEQKRKYDIYRLLQYDRIWGEQFIDS